MRLVTMSGPPSVGKTSVIVKIGGWLRARGQSVGVAKFDALSGQDEKIFRRHGLAAVTGLAGSICPDHYFVTNIADCVAWGERQGLDWLFTESAGLCNRCSPHIEEVLAVCVIDALSGVHTPAKIGPMLRLADVVLITKADIVSQIEREVFSHQVHLANPRARIMLFNGITGQGAIDLGRELDRHVKGVSLENRRLRFPMPSAVCSYCVGETQLGEQYQRGNLKKIHFRDGDVPGAGNHG